MKMRFTVATILATVCFYGAASAQQTGPSKVYHLSDFGWTANQDVSEEFAKLMDSGTLKAGEEMVLDHKYRISGSYALPENFTLSAVEGAGFNVTDAAKPKAIMTSTSTIASSDMPRSLVDLSRKVVTE